MQWWCLPYLCALVVHLEAEESVILGKGTHMGVSLLYTISVLDLVVSEMGLQIRAPEVGNIPQKGTMSIHLDLTGRNSKGIDGTDHPVPTPYYVRADR